MVDGPEASANRPRLRRVGIALAGTAIGVGSVVPMGGTAQANEPAAGGVYVIEQVTTDPNTGMALTNPWESGATERSYTTLQPTDSKLKGQQWQLEFDSEGNFKMKNVASGLCLASLNSENGGAVLQSTCAAGGGGGPTTWKAIKQADGTYKLQNQYNKKYLDSFGSSSTRQSIVHSDDTGSGEIRRSWVFKGTSNGLYWKRMQHTSSWGGGQTASISCNDGDSVVFAGGKQGSYGTPGQVKLGDSLYAYTNAGTSDVTDLKATVPSGKYWTGPGRSGWYRVDFSFTSAIDAKVSLGVLCRDGTNMSTYNYTEKIYVKYRDPWQVGTKVSRTYYCADGFGLNPYKETAIAPDSYTNSGQMGYYGSLTEHFYPVKYEGESEMAAAGSRFPNGKWHGGMVTWENRYAGGDLEGTTTWHCSPGRG